MSGCLLLSSDFLPRGDQNYFHSNFQNAEILKTLKVWHQSRVDHKLKTNSSDGHLKMSFQTYDDFSCRERFSITLYFYLISNNQKSDSPSCHFANEEGKGVNQINLQQSHAL